MTVCLPGMDHRAELHLKESERLVLPPIMETKKGRNTTTRMKKGKGNNRSRAIWNEQEYTARTRAQDGRQGPMNPHVLLSHGNVFKKKSRSGRKPKPRQKRTGDQTMNPPSKKTKGIGKHTCSSAKSVTSVESVVLEQEIQVLEAQIFGQQPITQLPGSASRPFSLI